MQIIYYTELINDFSSSCCDCTLLAEKLINNFLGFTPDGSMINLNTLPILLSNVLKIHSEKEIRFNLTTLNNGNFNLTFDVVKQRKSQKKGGNQNDL